ncbi:MAG: transcription antitermination factor NusB [Candidimonas sp.]|nr:MAG: transcription antitermination factor NusB [Candidimonas sp.]
MTTTRAAVRIGKATLIAGKSPRDRAGRSGDHSPRRRAREFALQGIYSWLLRGASDADTADVEADIRADDAFPEADAQWFKTLLHGVFREAAALRERFAPYVDRPLREVSPIEHGILLIGCYELLFCVDVPYRVTINEAVELAKSFGGTDGFKFVNGVLDKVAADVRPAEIKASRR